MRDIPNDDKVHCFACHRLIRPGQLYHLTIEFEVLCEDCALSEGVIRVRKELAVEISRELLGRTRCKRFLFSTKGACFEPPDPAAVARVIKWGGHAPNLAFNHRNRYTEHWGDPSLTDKYGHTAEYPQRGEEGLRIDL